LAVYSKAGQLAVLPGDEFIHSYWLLKFFGRTPFIGVVFHSAEALLASERTAIPEPASEHRLGATGARSVAPRLIWHVR